MPSPRLSLIVPVYKTEAYLLTCLESLSAQTYSDLEILCINDGSPDNSLEILHAYAQKEPRLRIFSQENEGIAAARNLGIEQARGEYIGFIDSDDFLSPTCYERLIAALEKDNSDFACCDVALHPEEGFWEGIEPNFVADLAKYFALKEDGHKLLTPDSFKQLSSTVWNRVFRKELIERYLLRYPATWYEDTYFSQAYSLVSSSFSFVAEKLYHYRLRPDSVMHQTLSQRTKRVIEGLDTTFALFEFMQKHPELAPFYPHFFQYYVNHFSTLLRYCPEESLKEELTQKAKIQLTNMRLESFLPQLEKKTRQKLAPLLQMPKEQMPISKKARLKLAALLGNPKENPPTSWAQRLKTFFSSRKPR